MANPADRRAPAYVRAGLDADVNSSDAGACFEAMSAEIHARQVRLILSRQRIVKFSPGAKTGAGQTVHKNEDRSDNR